MPSARPAVNVRPPRARDNLSRAEPATPRGQASRQRLIEAARAELIGRSGQLEVDSVARRAGTSIGLIYRHFGNRAGLVGAVVDDFYSRYRAEALEINPAPGASFAVRERKRTQLSVAFHYREPLARVILSSLHLDAEVAVHENAHLDEMSALAAEVMRLGHRRGELPKDRDPELVAAMVIGGMRHLLATALATEVSETRAANQLWRFIAEIMGLDPGDR